MPEKTCSTCCAASAYFIGAACLSPDDDDKNREPVFASFDAACAAARCLGDPRCHGDAVMIARMLMPDHLHLLLQLGQRDSLAQVVSRLKATSARVVNGVLHREGAVWSRGFHDHALRSDESLEAIARYIVANPVRAGLVRGVGDYPFWDAGFLADGDVACCRSAPGRNGLYR